MGRKKFRYVIVMFFALALATVFMMCAACDDFWNLGTKDEDEGEAGSSQLDESSLEVELVTLSEEELFFAAGETATLSAEAETTSGDVYDGLYLWDSSDTDVVNFSSSAYGEIVTVKGYGPGTSVVTVTAGGVSAECLITVTEGHMHNYEVTSDTVWEWTDDFTCVGTLYCTTAGECDSPEREVEADVSSNLIRYSSCSEEGKVEYVAKRNGIEVSRTSESLGLTAHTYDADHFECGLVREDDGKVYAEATFECAVCGEESVTASEAELGDDWSYAATVTDPYGEEVYSFSWEAWESGIPAEHDFVFDDNGTATDVFGSTYVPVYDEDDMVGYELYSMGYGAEIVFVAGEIAGLPVSVGESISGASKPTVSIGDTKVNNPNTTLKTLVIEDGVTSVGNNAFIGCTALEHLSLGNTVTDIGKYAFYYCPELESIEIPESVTYINQYAFSYCTGVTEIVIHGNSSGKSLDKYSFSSCTSLVSLTFTEGNISIGDYAFRDATSLECISVYGDITSIGSYAFNGCENLTTMIITGSMTSIGTKAFSNTFTAIYFDGTESQWSSVKSAINKNNSSSIANVTVYYYREEEPVGEDGDFWHWSEDGTPAVWSADDDLEVTD